MGQKYVQICCARHYGYQQVMCVINVNITYSGDVSIFETLLHQLGFQLTILMLRFLHRRYTENSSRSLAYNLSIHSNDTVLDPIASTLVIIDCVAEEIIRLVASICVCVHPFVCGLSPV